MTAATEETFTHKRYSINKIIFTLLYISVIAYLVWSVVYIHIISIKLGFSVFVMLTFIYLVSLIMMLPEIKGIMNDMDWNEDSWGKGYQTENLVLKQLQALPIKKYVIEDFKINNGNIDFILISERCIMAIEVKSTKGIMRLKGNDFYINQYLHNEDIDQAEKEFEALRKIFEYKFGNKYLPLGLLEYPYAESDGSVNKRIKNVNIGGKEYHNYLIHGSKLLLSDQELKKIFDYFMEIKLKNKETRWTVWVSMLRRTWYKIKKDPMLFFTANYEKDSSSGEYY